MASSQRFDHIQHCIQESRRRTGVDCNPRNQDFPFSKDEIRTMKTKIRKFEQWKARLIREGKKARKLLQQMFQ